MRSKVAETARGQQRDEHGALTVDERLALMLELGKRQLQTYMTMHGVTHDEAMRQLEHATQAGRQRSDCMERIIDVSRPDSSRDPR